MHEFYTQKYLIVSSITFVEKLNFARKSRIYFLSTSSIHSSYHSRAIDRMTRLSLDNKSIYDSRCVSPRCQKSCGVIGRSEQRRMSPGRSDIRRRIRESRSLARLLPADSCLKLTSIQWIEQWGSKEGRGTGYGAGNKPGRGSLRALLHPSQAWPPPSFLRPRVHNSSSASFGTKSQGSKGGHAFIYPRSSSIRWKPLVVRNFQRVASIMLFIFFFF